MDVINLDSAGSAAPPAAANDLRLPAHLTRDPQALQCPVRGCRYDALAHAPVRTPLCPCKRLVCRQCLLDALSSPCPTTCGACGRQDVVQPGAREAMATSLVADRGVLATLWHQSAALGAPAISPAGARVNADDNSAPLPAAHALAWSQCTLRSHITVPSPDSDSTAVTHWCSQCAAPACAPCAAAHADHAVLPLQDAVRDLAATASDTLKQVRAVGAGYATAVARVRTQYSRLVANRHTAIVELDQQLARKMALLQEQHRQRMQEVEAAFEAKAGLLLPQLADALGGVGEARTGEALGGVALDDKAPAVVAALAARSLQRLRYATSGLGKEGRESHDGGDEEQQQQQQQKGAGEEVKVTTFVPVDIALRVTGSRDEQLGLGEVRTASIDVSKCSLQWEFTGGLTAVVTLKQPAKTWVPLKADDVEVELLFTPRSEPGGRVRHESCSGSRCSRSCTTGSAGAGTRATAFGSASDCVGPRPTPDVDSSYDQTHARHLDFTCRVQETRADVKFDVPSHEDGTLHLAVSICGVPVPGSPLARECRGASARLGASTPMSFDLRTLVVVDAIDAGCRYWTGHCIAVCPFLGVMATPRGERILITPLGGVVDRLRAVAHGDAGPFTPESIGARTDPDAYELPFTLVFDDSRRDFLREHVGYFTFAGPPSARVLLVPDMEGDAVLVIDVAARERLGYLAAPPAVAGPRAVAARGRLAAVTAGRMWCDPVVHVFEGEGTDWVPLWVIGSGIVTLGCGPDEGDWSRPGGLCFTADGAGLAVASGPLSLFSMVDGTFVGNVAEDLGNFAGQVVACEGGGWLVAGIHRPQYFAGQFGADLGEVADFAAGSGIAMARELGLMFAGDTSRPRDRDRVLVYATPDAVAMAVMSPTRIAWMVAAVRSAARAPW